MKKIYMAILVIAGLLAATLIGLMVYLHASGDSFAKEGESFLVPDLTNRQVFAAEDITDLTINYTMDTLQLLPSSTGEIILEEYLSYGFNEQYYAETNQQESHLHIKSGIRPVVQIGIHYNVIKLYVPQDWQGNFVYSGSSGGLKTETDWQFKEFEAGSSSGSIRLSAIKTEQNISLQASSGGISANELVTSQGGVSLSANSGSIRVGNITGKTTVEAKTSSGSLHMKNITTQGEILLNSSSGSIKGESIETQENIAVSTTSGSIRITSLTGRMINTKSSSGSQNFDEINGKLLATGSSGRISVGATTGGGSIESTSGSVDWKIIKLTENVAVSVSSGSLRLVVPQEADFTGEFKSGSGSVKTDLTRQSSGSEDGKTKKVVVGENPSLTITGRSSSGSVRITQE